LEDQDIDGGKQKNEFSRNGIGGMDSTYLVHDGEVAGSSKYGNEPSGSVKCGEFLD
jgi:hypothetical protein